MKQKPFPAVKNGLPYAILFLIFLVIFLDEFRTGHGFIIYLSAAGMLTSLVAAVLSMVRFERSRKSILNLIKVMNRGYLPAPDSLEIPFTGGELEKEMKKFIRSQQELIDYARALDKGNFSGELQPLGDDDQLRRSFISLGRRLEQSRIDRNKREEQDEQRAWIAGGQAHFGSLLRETEDSYEKMAVSLIRELVDYTVASVGGLFLVVQDEKNSEKMLDLIGSYAFDRQKFINRQFRFGEGLVGRAALEKEPVYITDVPEDYIKIRSGLGEHKPASILILPIILDQEVLAVLELASFEPFPDYQVDFIRSLNGPLAITLSRMQINIRKE
ncbi:MAG: GAF domain-containing protein [Bacteroidales bacterium]|nr:GAF domain-containing protein [Bacteroidales bacterium]MBN2699605.1 GAF domain-containing protein [Bacteroidales bacterium]